MCLLLLVNLSGCFGFGVAASLGFTFAVAIDCLDSCVSADGFRSLIAVVS